MQGLFPQPDIQPSKAGIVNSFLSDPGSTPRPAAPFLMVSYRGGAEKNRRENSGKSG
jgi:hypothetical protein